MTKTPRRPSVSVVVPCHNDGRYLPNLVSKLLGQSLQPLEIIVIDDASTDDSIQIVETLKKSHPELRLVRNKKNLGVIHSINRGVGAALGEFIYMTGCDDLPLPGLFEKSVAMMTRYPSAPVCFSNPCAWNEAIGKVDENAPDLGQTAGLFEPEDLALGFGVLPYIHPHSGLIRKTEFDREGGYDPEIGPSADWFLWLSLAFRRGACYIPEPLSLWRVRPESYLHVALRDDSERTRIAKVVAERLLLSTKNGDIYPHFVVSNALSIFGSTIFAVILGDPRFCTARGLGLLCWENAGSDRFQGRNSRALQWQLATDQQHLLPLAQSENAVRTATPEPPATAGGGSSIPGIALRLGVYEALRNLKRRIKNLKRRIRNLKRRIVQGHPPPLAALRGPAHSKSHFSEVVARKTATVTSATAIAHQRESTGDLPNAIEILRAARRMGGGANPEMEIYLATLELKNADYRNSIATFSSVGPGAFGTFSRSTDLPPNRVHLPRPLGASGPMISGICVGGNMFGRFCDERQTRELLAAAREHGLNFIDTSDSYSDGLSELLVGKAIKRTRTDWVIASKAGIASYGSAVGLGRRANIRAKVEGSLRRLGIECIDVYQMHHFDRATPFEETLGALEELRLEGKIRHAAVSNYDAGQLRHAVDLARARALAPIVSVQNHFHMLKREGESSWLPYCATAGIGVLAYGVLARGILGGKYLRGAPLPEGSRASVSESIRSDLEPDVLDVVEELSKLACELGVKVGQLTVAWTINRPGVTSVILGMRSPAQLEDHVPALGLRLQQSVLKKIETILGPRDRFRRLALGAYIPA